MEQLLALGTVVRVNLGRQNTAWMMIAGYAPRDNTTGEVYDYAAVLYPVGMSFRTVIQGINRGAILEVAVPGYLDEEGKILTEGLPELFETAREVMNEWENRKEEKSGPADPFAEFG